MVLDEPDGTASATDDPPEQEPAPVGPDDAGADDVEALDAVGLVAGLIGELEDPCLLCSRVRPMDRELTCESLGL